MSEQNILNSTQTSLLNPDYGYTEGLPNLLAEWQAASGKWFGRQRLARGRIYELAWNDRDKATMHSLKQWERQYEKDAFSFQDFERSRYFSGRFDGPLVYSPVGNEQWNIRGRFIELPGLAIYTYPSDWSRDAAFLEEALYPQASATGREDQVKLTGSWTLNGPDNSAFHGVAVGRRAAYFSNTTDNTAEWVYFGYGFRFWSPKNNNLGIVGIGVTKVRDGTTALSEQTVDLYAATLENSAALFIKSDLPLDWYRVKLRVTGTKNASSSDYRCYADAIETMG
jgi:hypothetical protein